MVSSDCYMKLSPHDNARKPCSNTQKEIYSKEEKLFVHFGRTTKNTKQSKESITSPLLIFLKDHARSSFETGAPKPDHIANHHHKNGVDTCISVL